MTTHPERTIRVAGGWLAAASLLFVGSLALHPPPSPDPDAFMQIIANAGTRWVVAHWAAALALSAFAVTSLIVLTAHSRLTENWWTISAWAILPVSSFWVLTAAVAEATVISHAARAGDQEMFQAWQRFAEGKAMGVLGLALSIALIAGNEARSGQPTTPAWACWAAIAAALGAFAGWTMGMVLDVAAGGIIWLVSAMAMGLWTLWLGLALARSEPEFAHHAADAQRAMPPS
jgi:hypothetical protein